MGYSPTEYAEFTEPPAEVASHGFLLRRVWHLAIPTPPAMGYSPTEYAEFTEPPAEMSSHGFHRFTQILRVRCSPTEFTEFGSVGMAGMPYPPTSVSIRAICGRLFSAKSFCAFRAFCGNLFPPTDFTDLHRYLWCAVLPQNSQNTQNWAAWVWQGCHTLLICEHPCHLWESFLCNRFCEFRAFCGNLFPPTDFTDLHRYLGCAVLPQNSQNSQNLVAWVWQGCHTLLICAICGRLFSARGSVSSVLICGRLFSARSFCAFRAFCGNIFSPTDFTDLHICTPWAGSVGMAGMPYPPNLCASVSSVGVLSLQGVLCIRCIPWELLHRLFGWCS